MTMLKVRVEILDEPGALARLTTALASLAVDVADIDVLELDGRSVVDEMLLRLPDAVTVQQVQDVLRAAGADVLSFRPAASAKDAAVAAFDLTRSVLAAPWDADLPGQSLARVAHADVGALVDVGECARFPLAQRALEQGIPATGPADADSSPLALTTGWVLWVAPQLPGPHCVAVVGRRLNVRFAATEAARLRAFCTLLEEVRRVRT